MEIEVLVGLLIGLCGGLFCVALAATVFSILAYAKVVGMEKSTHQVTYYNPLEQDSQGPDIAQEARKAFGFVDEEVDHNF